MLRDGAIIFGDLIALHVCNTEKKRTSVPFLPVDGLIPRMKLVSVKTCVGSCGMQQPSDHKSKEVPMIKVLLPLAAIGGLLIASSPAAVAKGPGGGASTFSPGQQFIANGKLPPTGSAAPGASGFAPGQEFIANDKLPPTGSTAPGASGFSPGSSIVNPK